MTHTLMKLPERNAPFVMLDDSNTAVITLNNPFTGEVEQLSTLADYPAIANCVLMFAQQHNLNPCEVEYSILWPTQDAECEAYALIADQCD